MKICKVEDCDIKATRKGMCQKHYARIWRNGTLEVQVRGAYPRKTRCCEVEGCSKVHYANGLCSMHYMRKQRHGSEEIVNKSGRKLGETERKCEVKGCNNKHIAKGLCMKHYKMQRRELGIDK